MFGSLGWQELLIILVILALYFFTDLAIRGWTSILGGVLLTILLQVLFASVGAAFLYPVSIARIAAWAKGLESRGFVLVPVSAILAQPK